jgi:hypothetical protein
LTFEPFLAAFREVDRPTASAWQGALQAGWKELLTEHGGATFDDGLYRLHSPETSVRADEAVAAAFPELRGRVRCFGFDWLGRQFAIDVQAPEAESIRLIEPGTGEVLSLPASFIEFHNALLLSYRDAALASTFFESWSASNREALPLRADRCVGYRVPLFLGGVDDLANLEETDIWVYWAISGQLLDQTRGLPAETPISGVRVE